MRQTFTAIALLIALVAPAAAENTIPPDITVAADGSGDFTSVHQAVQSISKDNRDRIVIFIKDGVYREKVRVDAACVTLRGQSRKGTRIEFPQLHEEFEKKPDDVGRAVINVGGDDLVLDTLTVHNTAGVVGPHAFAIYGKADRTVIVDCDVLSEGADTVALWAGDRGRYYHARCHFRGAVDFVCPRGWCYVVDSTFYETKATAALWHDGSKDRDMKFVLRNCKLDGVDGWTLARHHHDAAFYLLDCVFSKTMIDRAPYRVVYPIGDKPATEADVKRNAELDKTNRWGERAYFHNCLRDGGDYPWHADNLASAPSSPKPADVTAKWTFAGKWDPERSDGPKIVNIARRDDGHVAVTFDERVTVKGKPRLAWPGSVSGGYVSGSGSETLLFDAAGTSEMPLSIDPNGGSIIATEASARLRPARLSR